MTESFAPGRKKAEQRHGDSACNHGERGHLGMEWRNRYLSDREAESEIEKADTKERYVPQPEHTSRKGTMTAKPVITVKKKSDEGTRKPPSQNSDPTGK